MLQIKILCNLSVHHSSWCSCELKSFCPQLPVVIRLLAFCCVPPLSAQLVFGNFAVCLCCRRRHSSVAFCGRLPAGAENRLSRSRLHHHQCAHTLCSILVVLLFSLCSSRDVTGMAAMKRQNYASSLSKMKSVESLNHCGKVQSNVELISPPCYCNV